MEGGREREWEDGGREREREKREIEEGGRKGERENRVTGLLLQDVQILNPNIKF